MDLPSHTASDAPATAPPATPPTLLGRLDRLIFTDDFSQRRRIAMVLMTAFMYAVCVLLLTYGVWHGIFDPLRVGILGTACASTAIVFFTIVRSGFNLRFRRPSLAFPQAMVGQTLVVLAYAVSGPAHASNLVLLVLVVCLCMFDMSIRDVRILTVYTIFALGVAMAWCVNDDPLTYPPKLELISFVMTAAVLVTTSLLSAHLSKMRNRLRVQKTELEAALAHINKIATLDELTGLPNRRHVLTLIAQAIARHARGGPGFAVAIADLDYFKKVNDTFGHRVGDDALAGFATHARAHLRNTDVVARWGGEEFLLLMPGMPPDDPNVGIERLRAALASIEISEQAPQLRLAFSAGLTRYVAGEAIDDMIERADGALYEAKAAGRNRTVTR